MYCTNCGKQNPEGNSFCVFCGTPLKTGINKTSGTGNIGQINNDLGTSTPNNSAYNTVENTINTLKTRVLDAGITTNILDGGIKSKAAILIPAIVIVVIIIIFLLTSNSGMKGAAEEYVSYYCNGSHVRITEYEKMDSDDLESLEWMIGVEPIKKAIYDVKLTYTNEYGESDYTYVDVIYKDSYGWHVAD